MSEGSVSLTALGAALRRAAHQVLDEPVVFADPLAVPILGPSLQARLEERLRTTELDPHASSLRAFLAARSRLCEDELAHTRVKQYVLLGAGLDTFAHRNPFPALRVFEVDAPATQAFKRTLLADRDPPPGLVYAPCDFERESLADALARAGFDDAAPAFFAWLGVVPYLTHAAAVATLSFIAARPAAVVFDYALPSARAGDLEPRVAQLGEPFRLFFEPPALERELVSLGFASCRDHDPEALNRRYFAGRDAIRGRAGHVMACRTAAFEDFTNANTESE